MTKLRESKLLQLYQHKTKPEIKVVAKVAENEKGYVKILMPRLFPVKGAPYLMRHMWSKAPDAPLKEFLEFYEPVLLHQMDEVTAEFHARLRRGE